MRHQTTEVLTNNTTRVFIPSRDTFSIGDVS